MQVDKDLIRELAELINDTDLSEIEVEDGDRKIKLSRNGTPAPHYAAPAPVAAPVAAVVAAPVADAPSDAIHPGTVFSPMVGTIYTSPDPESPVFIKVGDTVSAGQTILIVEAMKVMNQINATNGGTVKAIMVENAQPVEYGEALIIIE
ncbi:MAG: acetyl-CoA carboxylase biotin carboxyl carrier protein [Kordiimonadaceae bacterium]|nr:acetyl-CoA carboxylase biotin carboxyl carrier protein [Kordiimonadaceae bacterium]MBT6033022.1 acetyl-CoA carboxylase biotin carboxyl carrier protein [Kordiimonadaceae bacterium]